MHLTLHVKPTLPAVQRTGRKGSSDCKEPYQEGYGRQERPIFSPDISLES